MCFERRKLEFSKNQSEGHKMKHGKTTISILLVLLMLVLPLFNITSQKYGHELQMKTGDSDLSSKASDWVANGTVICTANLDQSNARLCRDAGGGAFIAWEDYRTGGVRDIYVQRISASGYIQGTINGVVICNATQNQYLPQLCTDGVGGGAIITWYDNRSGSNFDIYVQHVSAMVVRQWIVNGVVICNATNDQTNPQICSDGDGGAIITWHDFRSGSNRDIYAQRISKFGNVMWAANGVPICTAADTQQFPQICSDGSGGAIITWQDYRSGSYWDIYAQRVNMYGAVQWTANGVIICNANYDQSSPQICSDESGGVIITWQDYRTGSNWDIYAQRVNGSGSIKWTSNGGAATTAASSQIGPQLCSAESGAAIITWQDYRSGSSYDIYAQYVSPTGTIGWAFLDGTAICTANGDQLAPQICIDDIGGAFITWYDRRSGSHYDIYAQLVNRHGEKIWINNGVAICSVNGDQTTAQICYNEEGGAVITWRDWRSGSSWDIYAQVVGPSGPPDFLVEAPIRVSANPSSWSTSNSFNISWANPFDPSGFMGAYYKLDSPPTSNSDGTYVVSVYITNIPGITVSGSGAHEIYVWLVDGVGNVDFHKYATTTLYLSEPPSEPIPFPLPLILILALVIAILGIAKFKSKSDSKA